MAEADQGKRPSRSKVESACAACAARVGFTLAKLQRMFRTQLMHRDYSDQTRIAFFDLLKSMRADQQHHKDQASLLRQPPHKTKKMPTVIMADCRTCNDTGTTPTNRPCRKCAKGISIKQQRLEEDRALLNFSSEKYEGENKGGRPRKDASPQVQDVRGVESPGGLPER